MWSSLPCLLSISPRSLTEPISLSMLYSWSLISNAFQISMYRHHPDIKTLVFEFQGNNILQNCWKIKFSLTLFPTLVPFQPILGNIFQCLEDLSPYLINNVDMTCMFFPTWILCLEISSILFHKINLKSFIRQQMLLLHSKSNINQDPKETIFWS